MRNALKSLSIVVALSGFVALSGCGSNDDAGLDGTEPAASGDVATPGGESGSAAGTAADARREDSLHPVVLLKTSMGRITIKLDREKAPITVDNFLSYVDQEHYDGTIFHDVFEGAVVQGGLFTAALEEKEGNYPIRNEADNGLKNVRGTIAMYRGEAIDSATCQFFLNAKDNPIYDHQPAEDELPSSNQYGYCVFGQVTEGMDVVDRIAAVATKHTEQLPRLPVETVLIESVEQIR